MGKPAQVTIRFRLIASCLALLILNTAIALFVHQQQHQVGDRAMTIYDSAFIGLNYVTKVQNGLVRLSAPHANASNPLAASSVEAELHDLMANLTIAIDRAMTEDTKAAGRAVMRKLDELSRTSVPQLFTIELADIDRDLTTLVHRYGANGLAARDEVAQSVDQADWFTVTLSALGVLLSFGIAVNLGYAILPSLRRAVEVADAVAQGKLDTVIATGGVSETSRLMRALNRMQTEIAQNAKRIETLRNAEADRQMLDLQRESEEARERQHLAEESSRAKSTFLAMMSHEIRTPMNAILGLSSMLLSERLTREQHESAQAIHSSGTGLLRILNDILDFSRLDAGRMSFEYKALSPASLTSETLHTHRLVAEGKGLRLMITAEPDLPARLIGDDGRIGQVLHNLVSNAIKFTRTGEVTVRTSCVARDAEDATIEWTVADTGIGIAPEKLSSLFDEFIQADSSITRRFGGSGLGLAICKKIIDQMGGTIAVESTLGVGTTFQVRLTLKQIHEHSSSLVASPLPDVLEQQIGTLGRPLRLLLAEDNDINKLVFSKLLQGTPISIDIASNGVQAARLAQENEYDLICMDINMPEMDGLEATRAIRRGHGPCHGIPIVAMTASAFPEDMEACRQAGMTDFVSKPMSKQTLFDVIVRALPLAEGSTAEAKVAGDSAAPQEALTAAVQEG